MWKVMLGCAGQLLVEYLLPEVIIIYWFNPALKKLCVWSIKQSHIRLDIFLLRSTNPIKTELIIHITHSLCS